MSKTGAGLAQWAENIHAGGRHVYWYGTYCNPCTKSLLNGKSGQYPTHYTDKRRATYEKHIAQGKTCTDCVGLIKGYYWEKDGKISYRRNGLPDKGSNGMYRAATIKGKIAQGMPEIPGLLVWTESKGHVAVYIGGGEVVEARGFSYGVQRNSMTKRKFVFWGMCPYIEYTAQEIETARAAAGTSGGTSTGTASSSTPTLRQGAKGEAVKKMQELLLAAGCTLPKHGADADFGAETLAAVKAFQAANSLEPDGICGPLTWAKLNAVKGSTSTGTAGSESTGTAGPVMINKPTLRKGDEGEAVIELQQRLLAAGCTLPRYGVDGKFGSETRAAVKAFQTANSLNPDGICGPLTWTALGG